MLPISLPITHTLFGQASVPLCIKKKPGMKHRYILLGLLNVYGYQNSLWKSNTKLFKRVLIELLFCSFLS